MFLKDIKLTNFKNYEFGNFDFSEKVNLIVGLNGVGKTNLLDAVYYACMCKSRFSGSDRNILRKSIGGEESKADFFRLELNFLKKKKKEKVVAKVKPGNLKVFEINEVPGEKLADHIGNYPVVMVVPDDALLLLDGSESRRLLIDNVLSQMERPYLTALMTYNRILKQRNAALKGFIENKYYNVELVRAYNRQLIPPAETVHELRKDFIVQFNFYLAEFYKEISGDREQISCDYKSVLHEEKAASIFERNMEKDRLNGRTSEGIHKDDLVFKMSGLPLKRFASQGQLKSFVLAVKLAQYELLRLHKGITPLLLLDDIFAKLDNRRVSHLLRLLNDGKTASGNNRFGQIFITDTHEDRGEEILESLGTNFKKFHLLKEKA